MTSPESLAKNEALYRLVNEQIETLNDRIPRHEATTEFLCECERQGCFEKVIATRAEYESVRAVSTHFLVHRGHVDPRIEHVAFANDRFAVVEKEGEAASVAREENPRRPEA